MSEVACYLFRCPIMTLQFIQNKLLQIKSSIKDVPSLSSLQSHLLSCIGPIFTRRSFITFKLPAKVSPANAPTAPPTAPCRRCFRLEAAPMTALSPGMKSLMLNPTHGRRFGRISGMLELTDLIGCISTNRTRKLHYKLAGSRKVFSIINIIILKIRTYNWPT